MKHINFIFILIFLLYLFLPSNVIADSFINIDNTDIMLIKGEQTNIKLSLKNAAGRLDIKSDNNNIVSTNKDKVFLDNSKDEIVLKGINVGKTKINIKSTDVSSYDLKELNNITNSVNVTVYIKGDINKTGKIELNDILTLLKKYTGTITTTKEDKVIGDIDNNGIIDAKDIILLLRKYLGTN